MSDLDIKMKTNDYTQDIQSENPVNNPTRADVEEAIIFSGLELPTVNMNYVLFTKNGKMNLVVYRAAPDEYGIVSGSVV